LIKSDSKVFYIVTKYYVFKKAVLFEPSIHQRKESFTISSKTAQLFSTLIIRHIS